ncbi:MAG: hypothetical protein AAB401_16425 [Acidobacteriota bacterium]
MRPAIHITVAMILIFCLSGFLLAQSPWEKKPYAEWSDKDAQKLLSESPWSQTQVFSDTSQMTGTARQDSSASRIANVFHVNFRIRFLSAKPVRQAVSRSMELKQKGAMPEQLAAQLKAFAAADFPDFIIVTALCDSDQPNIHLQEANARLNNRTTADLKNNTYLELKNGKRLFLHEYQPPRNDGLGARFVFPRLVDGKAFITPEGGEVRFVADLSEGGTPTKMAYRLDRRFKISDMNFQGKLEY